uniref:DUF1758 domain-containing protein n=1 Tax=Brugia malayi TaxID=6279 RepID=A8P6R6_BRUMA
MFQRNEEQERIGPSKRKDCSTSLYNSTLTTRSKQTKETLLLCKEIKVFNPSQPQLQQNALALFDIGSQLSFISKKLSRQLKLTETETQIMRIAPFGMKEPKSCPTARIQVNVLTNESEIVPLQANIIDYLKNELQIVETSNEFQIQNLTNYWKKPDVLIGADYFFKFISLREIKELKSGHMLVQSKVGPMIVGKTIGIQESPQDDDDQALKHFKRTIIKQGGGYQVCWPWKDSKQKLSNNYGLRPGRLKNLINRLQHNSNLHSYHQILMDQLHSGIIEEVPLRDEVGVIHYLPHHEVLTPSKSTTKLRIVYDVSAHHKGFKSLNEVLYRGPVMLPNLVGVILRFRMMKIVIRANIEKAFLQLELQNEERNCTRFLWLDDIDKELTNENIKCYRFKRTTLFNSANGTEEALYKYERTKEIFGEASMNIREFLSNNEEFNERIPECDLSQTNQENFLGLKWNHERDIIRVTLKPWIGKSLTKRTILQFIASQYDPLSLLVPTMIIQHLWKENIPWDQSLNKQNEQQWINLIKKWPTNIIELPRFVMETSQLTEFHIFTDASKVAYSAAIYILNHGYQDTYS